MRLTTDTFILTWSNGKAPLHKDDLYDIWPSQNSRLQAEQFTGGYVGWMCYEARHKHENIALNRPAPNEPLVLFWPCDGAIHINCRDQNIKIHGSKTFKREARELLSRPTVLPSTSISQTHQPTFKRDAFIEAVNSIKADIKSGLVYQVNLSWAHEFVLNHPLNVFEAIFHHNPARYASILKYGEYGVVSNSPELFLKVKPNDTMTNVTSCPIKGTANQTTPDALKTLWHSPKEHAELSMIVDMVRNDLGRLASPGCVHVHHRRIRRCGDLLHAEQQICASIPSHHSIGDILDATFPPASVTGAPKISAMKTIERLEKKARGIYTGCIGYIGYDGQAQFSVAIRCIPFQHNHARLHVGAGIVYDSSPQHEWLETLAKARAIHHILSHLCE